MGNLFNTNLSEKKAKKIQELLQVVGLEDYAHVLPKI